MSNPQTYYLTKNQSNIIQDLSGIFQPLTGTTKAANTGYTTIINNVSKDMSDIFQPAYGTTYIGFNTGYQISNGTDFRYIFSPYLSTFNSLSGAISANPSTLNSGTLANNFTMPTGYNYFNFAIYGGGGNGSQAGSSTYGTGGGGAGAFIEGTNIPYTKNTNNIIKTITYQVSGGGQTTYNTTVSVTYTDGTSINLTSGPGYSTNLNSGTAGAAGGLSSSSNNTSISINIIQANGTAGGNQGSNGTTNNYTSSGSGNDGGTSAPHGNPPSATKTYTAPNTTYTVTSSGGGKSQVTSGYGAGGAATPANYYNSANPNASATDYRTGTPGIIIYWLS
jgi:hypothetical protein